MLSRVVAASFLTLLIAIVNIPTFRLLIWAYRQGHNLSLEDQITRAALLFIAAVALIIFSMYVVSGLLLKGFDRFERRLERRGATGV